MDVAKVVRKVVPPKSGDINSLNKSSSLSRLQATKNHVSSMRAGTCSQGSAADRSKSSKGRPPKPELRPKPQALVEMMRQEKLAKKFRREGVKDSNDDCIDNEVADDSGDESGGPTVEMRIKGVNLKFEDSVFEEEKEATDEIDAKPAVTKSSGISSDVAITSSPTLPQASSHDTVEKPNHDHHTKETSKLVISDNTTSTSQQKDAKSNGHKKLHEEHTISPTSQYSSGDFSSNNKPSRLHMRAVTRHKSESSSPRDSSAKSSTLHKQSSDISFDRGRGHAKKLTSSVQVHASGHHAKDGGIGGEDFVESDDVIEDDDSCEEGGESFRTRVARFAREKFQKALSLGSPLQQLQSSLLTPGIKCIIP